MRQILQSLKDGSTFIAEVPHPIVGSNQVGITTSCTLISTGTEKMLINFGKSGFLDKARQQPDKVKMVLNKIKTDGFLATYETVKAKLDQPIPMGYCNVGRITELGSNVRGLSAGDRVVSNGNHAEYVTPSCNLVARIPENVSDEAAAFTVPGAIALQSVRLAKPEVGETFVVFGLGLLGLLTVQILRANGCKVIGIDFDDQKLNLAKCFGAETISLSQQSSPVQTVLSMTDAIGCDGVIIAAATDSDELMSQAAQMTRRRGRLILLGVTGLNLSRADFYEKELSFQVSCSYGAGRYDPTYEDKGIDYPIGFVRWTVKRNFEAVLHLLSSGAIKTEPLLSLTMPFLEVVSAYDKILSDKSILGLLLKYPNQEYVANRTVALSYAKKQNSADRKVRIGFIGTGGYATRFLLPALQKTEADLSIASSRGGISAYLAAEKYGFDKASTDIENVIDKSSDANLIFIATRHDTHAKLVTSTLAAGKSVFVEKPLALTIEELSGIKSSYENSKGQLMVGFNRRFSHYSKLAKKMLSASNIPKSLIYTINAGAIPGTHWIQDRTVGGGRVVGEVCHFIDLARYLIGSKITGFTTTHLGPPENNFYDTITIALTFEDHSIAQINYFANGHSAFPKERIEVFCGGKILQIDNFRKLRQWGYSGKSQYSSWQQDKGNIECVTSFTNSLIKGTESPIAVDELFEVSQKSIEIADSLNSGH